MEHKRTAQAFVLCITENARLRQSTLVSWNTSGTTRICFTSYSRRDTAQRSLSEKKLMAAEGLYIK